MGTSSLFRCGVRNYKQDSFFRAKKGDADFGEWPHVCAILSQNGPRKIYKCGASLLDDSIILTAAHCVHDLDASNIMVRCGEWDSRSKEEPLEHQDREVQEVKLHPEFKLKEHHYNFALLVVKQPFIRMDHIHP